MKNEKILEMLNNNQIEELKKQLQDEIYNDSLNSKAGAKQRYAAMKRYFKFVDSYNMESMKKPCKVNDYYSFLNDYSAVLTSESVGEIEQYDKSKRDYFKVETLFEIDGVIEKVNINQVLADAKLKGYKYKKSEVGTGKDFTYLFKYKNSYYKIGILDQAYSIINDGELAEVTYQSEKAPVLIKSSIGKCIILPVIVTNETVGNSKIVIELA